MIDVEEHLPMVRGIASSIYQKRKFRYEYEDLFQIGCIGLIKAINNFDETRGFKFSTYASKTIYGTIQNAIRDDSWYISKRVIDRTKNSYAPTSLDVPVGREKNTCLVDILSSTKDWQNHAEVRIAVNKLPVGLRELIVKKFFLGYTGKEIAKEDGVSGQAISNRTKKAFEILRKELEVC